MADSDKIVVEITKTEAPVKPPTYEWWICWRDKPGDKEFKCLSVDSPEQVSREVERLGKELAGREIWVSTLVGQYKSQVIVEFLGTEMQMAKTRCVN